MKEYFLIRYNGRTSKEELIDKCIENDLEVAKMRFLERNEQGENDLFTIAEGKGMIE